VKKGARVSRYPSDSPAKTAAQVTVVTTPRNRATPAKAVGAVPRLLSTRQAAEYLGVSANTIRKYRDSGKIRAFYVGEKLVKYDPEDLDRFLREFGE